MLLEDVAVDKAFTVLWERIARGRRLPALVKRGRVIGVCKMQKPYPVVN